MPKTSSDDQLSQEDMSMKGKSRSSSRGKSAAAIANQRNVASLKRKYSEISNTRKEEAKEDSNQQWCQKYVPQNLENLIIQKPKIAEFDRIVQNLSNKVLIFIGPPGSGKNTLIDCYCAQNKIQLVRYKEEKEKIILDTYMYNERVPEELDNLIEFIKSNSKTTKAAYFKTKSAFSGFSTQRKSPEEIKKLIKQDSITQGQQGQKKILVINGLPECIKIFHQRKNELISLFNQVVADVLFSKHETPLLIFTLSDSNEKSPSFLNRIFNREIMQQKGKAFQFLTLNPPTEKAIEKTLRNIIDVEEVVGVTETKIQEIRAQSNKDLRNAIQTLQFFSAGKKHENLEFIKNSQNKRMKPNEPRRNQVIDDSNMFLMDEGGFSKKRKQSNDEKQSFIKDNTLTIFHALGKFLYNKRINPNGGKIEQLSPKQMLSKNKPKLYFKHKDIIDQTQIESPNLALYMHENMLEFYSEIEDVANCIEVYSLTDYLESCVPFSFDQHQQIYEYKDFNAILNSMAITECNNHVTAPKQSHLFQMCIPQFYDHKRKATSNKQLIKDVAKEQQIQNGKLISEDLLIRSNKEIITNMLPFMRAMNYKSLQDLNEISTYPIYRQYGQKFGSGYGETKFVTEDDTRDNFEKEMMLEQNLKNAQKYMKSKQNKHTEQQSLQFQAKSYFVQQQPADEIHELNDSDLDLLLEDLQIEEDISDSD